MFTGMAPAGRHKQIKQFIPETGGMGHVAAKADEFSEIHIGKTPGVYWTGDTIFDWNGPIFRLVSAKDPVPDIQQVTEIGIDV